MPDLSKAYRRWRNRKLLLLLPAVAAAAALGTRQALRLDAASGSLWIDLACLGASAMLAAVCVWLSIRSALCSRRRSRSMRHELDSAGPVGIVVLSLVALVAVLPSCFPPHDPVPDVPVRVLLAARGAVETAPPELVAAGSEETAVAPPAVNVEPKRRSQGLLLGVETVESRIVDPQEDEPRPWTLEPRDPAYHRLGVPDARKPFQWMSPEIHVDVLLLKPGGEMEMPDETEVDLGEDLEMRGAGLRLYYDLPTARDEALRFQYQFFGLSAGASSIEIGEPEADDFLVWQRFGVSYYWQLLGYTSDATFDFAISVGLMGDSLLTAAHGGLTAEQLRVSPYFGAEIGFWQNGPAGLVIRVGQTTPLNLTGATANVTELTVLFRVDFTEGLSAHIGYGSTWARFRDYSKRGSDDGEQEEMMLLLHGPVFGFDLRF